MEMTIRQAREKANISIADLAYKIDVHPSYISLIERGKRKPTLDILVSIADVLGCTLDDLVAIDGRTPATA